MDLKKINKIKLLLVAFAVSSFGFWVKSSFADIRPSVSDGDYHQPYPYALLFLEAFFLTTILELLTAFVFISLAKLPKKVLLSVIAGNIISIPIVWYIFPLLQISNLQLALSEAFAALFEAFVIYFFNKEIISFKKSLLLSVLMNSVSFFIGGFLLYGF